MYRTWFRFLLLTLLAGCATPHAAPDLATAPIPALSYAAALDTGTVTPLQEAVIVKYGPYPTASFERLMRVTGMRSGETVAFFSRMTGTTSAVSSGDLVDITFAIEEMTSNPKIRADEADNLLRGTKIILHVEPYGLVRDVSVSLPPASASHATSEEIAAKVRGEFAGGGSLPKDGFHQGETLPIDTALPAMSGRAGGTLKGEAIVKGQGSYRGRPVIVLEAKGVGTLDDQPLGIHSYRFLDMATGLWSHSETAIAGAITVAGKKAQMNAKFINDVRF
jgi:hypothetical protein